MATEASNLTGRGMAVEPENIEKALKQLWEDSEGVSNRASLINFAIYSEAPDALEANSQVMAELTRDHACRALLINARPQLEESGVQSWINAHCHVSKGGAKQICCEELSFLLKGEAAGRISNIVFSHLDSDLPLVFWWQGEPHEFTDQHFWNYVDRLIVDSREWEGPRADFEFVRQLEARSKKLTVRDLNWTRFLHLRQATSKFFDHPDAPPQLGAIRRIEIVHGARSRLMTFLLVGWLGSQLGWNLEKYSMGRNQITLARPDGSTIEVAISQDGGPAINHFAMIAPQARFEIRRDNAGGHAVAEMVLPGRQPVTRVLPAARLGAADLINQELMRGSRHQIYSETVDWMLPLL